VHKSRRFFLCEQFPVSVDLLFHYYEQEVYKALVGEEHQSYRDSWLDKAPYQMLSSIENTHRASPHY
jgi:hypothetical protein